MTRIHFYIALVFFGLIASCKNNPVSDAAAKDHKVASTAQQPEKIQEQQELDITVHDESELAKDKVISKEKTDLVDDKIQLVDKDEEPKVAGKDKIKKATDRTVEKKEEVLAVKEAKSEIKKEQKKPSSTAIKTNSGKTPKVVVSEKKEIIEAKVKETKPIKEVKESGKKPEIFSHRIWNDLLQTNVSASGKVNYSNFKKNENQLDAYLKALSENTPQSDWSSKKEIAYWINAYNAGTVKLILKNHPLKSITKLHDGKPWDVKWLELGGKEYSLNEIENDILRPKFKDARVHFAVNCAAKSCPPLLNKAWTKENLEANYERQTKAFINNSAFNSITEKEIEISKIFEWYAKDFGDVITYLNKYSNTKISPSAKVKYKEYNWDLNN